MTIPHGFDAASFVRATLAEDLGEGGDITSAAVIPADARFAGVMAAREAIAVAGLPLASVSSVATGQARRCFGTAMPSEPPR